MLADLSLTIERSLLVTMDHSNEEIIEELELITCQEVEPGASTSRGRPYSSEYMDEIRDSINPPSFDESLLINNKEVDSELKHGIHRRESIVRRSSKYARFKPWEPTPGDIPMYDGPDMPTTDLPEDHCGPEPVNAPLDVSRLSKIPGYEGIGYHSNPENAPPIPPTLHDEVSNSDTLKQPEEQYESLSPITESQAKEALLRYVSRKCCYGKSAAKDMIISTITLFNALNYTLETYTETRHATWEQEPYEGQAIDGPSNGMAPGPWVLKCHPTQMFKDEMHSLEVPHTACVMSCSGCASLGWIRCHGCMGRGFKRCMYCNGTGRTWKTDAYGHRHPETCWHCHGTGRKRCSYCHGDGRVVCRTCKGFRQLKCYIKLIVIYSNNEVEHLIENDDLPEDILKQVTGELIFEQTQPRVWPISSYPDRELCRASQKLVNQQQNAYIDSRIIMQRQRLRAVPLSECLFSYKNKDGRFWICGKEQLVYAPGYPQKCCWGCVVL